MSDLYRIRRDLISILKESPSLDSLREFFAARTAEWPHPFMYAEYGTIGLFDDLATSLETQQAFGLIGLAVQLVLEQTDSDLFETALSLLVGLAEVSQTTEMPGMLRQSWEAIKGGSQSLLPADENAFWMEELCRLYRVSR